MYTSVEYDRVASGWTLHINSTGCLCFSAYFADAYGRQRLFSMRAAATDKRGIFFGSNKDIRYTLLEKLRVWRWMYAAHNIWSHKFANNGSQNFDVQGHEYKHRKMRNLWSFLPEKCRTLFQEYYAARYVEITVVAGCDFYHLNQRCWLLLMRQLENVNLWHLFSSTFCTEKALLQTFRNTEHSERFLKMWWSGLLHVNQSIFSGISSGCSFISFEKCIRWKVAQWNLNNARYWTAQSRLHAGKSWRSYVIVYCIFIVLTS